MDSIHKECIRRNLTMLCERLNPEPLHSYLLADGVFNDTSMQYIKAPRVQFEQNQKMCLSLMKRGPTAFEAFAKCLFKSGHRDIGQRLLVQDYQNRTGSNINSFDQLPATVRAKYNNLTDQESQAPIFDRELERRLTPNVRSTPQHGAGGTSVITQEVGNVQENAYYRKKRVEDVYFMETFPRGLMLIINNNKFPLFPEKMRERRGTNIDAGKLQGMFINFGFDVIREENLKAEEMILAIDRFRTRSHWENVGCCIVAILTHGKNVDGREYVFGTDGRNDPNEGLITLAQICQPFNAKNCPSLANKPKWFIFQACRGNIPDSGHIVSDGPVSMDPPGATGGQQSEHIYQNIEMRENLRRIPTEQDFLISYATAFGYSALRNTATGSWFIEGLCEVLEQFVNEEDVVSMLVKVNNIVASKSNNSNTMKQIPEPVVRLIKKWFLNPIEKN